MPIASLLRNVRPRSARSPLYEHQQERQQRCERNQAYDAEIVGNPPDESFGRRQRLPRGVIGWLAQQMDVMITTTEHAKQLAGMTGQAEKVAKIALRLQASSVAPIVKLSPGQRVGIVSQSLRFGALLRSFCDEYTQGLQIAGPALFDPPESLSAYLSGKDAVLVPEGYEKLCTQKALGLLTQFAAHARLISCSYQIDEGSAIYLTERLERLLANRSPK